MIRNLKTLGTAIAAVLSVGAVVAPGAVATDVFTASKEKAWVTGNPTNVVIGFKGLIEFKCTASKFTGTFLNGGSEITAHTSVSGKPNETPHGEDCTSPFGQAKIDMNDCHFVLTGSTTGSDAGTDATAWLQCPGGATIQITDTSGCTISIPSQTPTSGGATYLNLPNHAGGSAIQVFTTLTGITFSTNFICQLGGLPAESDNFNFVGTAILTGYEHLGGTMTAPIEGAQIPIQWS